MNQTLNFKTIDLRFQIPHNLHSLPIIIITQPIKVLTFLGDKIFVNSLNTQG